MRQAPIQPWHAGSTSKPPLQSVVPPWVTLAWSINRHLSTILHASPVGLFRVAIEWPPVCACAEFHKPKSLGAAVQHPHNGGAHHTCILRSSSVPRYPGPVANAPHASPELVRGTVQFLGLTLGHARNKGRLQWYCLPQALRPQQSPLALVDSTIIDLHSMHPPPSRGPNETRTRILSPICCRTCCCISPMSLST